ncbi:hypothetical protein ACFV8T_40485 [Streptomyces sp. NPDC059832]|uniref:hypothetical protein n=1 Tax=unclassified Streptomyces TaxID=2593676 RepID=UPI00365B66F9
MWGRGAGSRFGGECGIDAVHDVVRHVLWHGYGAEQLADLREGGMDLTAEFAAIHVAAHLCRT